MPTKVIIFTIFFTFITCNKNPYIHEGRTGIVLLFEWKFSDIAKECEFLAQVGYGAVQVSPVTEPKSDDTFSWYNRYSPVSYKVISPSGTIDDFREMVKECQKHKIRIYVDIVANHMANGDGDVYGFNKSMGYPKELKYPGVPFTHADFNENCELKDFSSAFQIRNCRVDGLPDLNQATENVRDKIVELMNLLIENGAAGFRMDSAEYLR